MPSVPKPVGVVAQFKVLVVLQLPVPQALKPQLPPTAGNQKRAIGVSVALLAAVTIEKHAHVASEAPTITCTVQVVAAVVLVIGQLPFMSKVELATVKPVQVIVDPPLVRVTVGVPEKLVPLMAKIGWFQVN